MNADVISDDPARREIGLLGGSFNPPHVAHVMAAYWALVTQGLSEVWLLPAFKHPFGKALAPFEDRVRMCERAAAAVRGLSVCRAEAALVGDPLLGKTVRTLEYLREEHPALRFALIVGDDIMAEAAKWYRWDRIQELARLVVVGRQGHAPDGAVAPALPEISSSEVRARLARGADASALVPREVLAYIEERGLYR